MGIIVAGLCAGNALGLFAAFRGRRLENQTRRTLATLGSGMALITVSTACAWLVPVPPTDVLAPLPPATALPAPNPTIAPPGSTPTLVPTSTIAPTSSTSVKISISARAGWVDTGLRLTPGQTLDLIASGTINLNNGAPAANSTAEGQLPNSCMEINCLVPGETYGALVGRLDDTPFRAGTSLEMPVASGGELYLAVNDADYADNSGNFIVTITVR